MRRGVATAGCLLVLLAATACGERSEPQGSSVPLYPVTIQGAGERPAVVSKTPRRIAALGHAPKSILRALGAADRLVHVESGLTGPALVHALERRRPDLIVATRTSDAIDLARARTRTHAAVYVAPDSSIDDVERAIDDLGLLVDRPLTARAVVAKIEGERRALAARLRGVATVRVFVDTGFFATVPDHSLIGDLVREAHGRSVAGASAEPGEPFELARLVQLDPQVYLATSDSGTTLAQLRKNPKTRRLSAVRLNRFGVIPERLVEPGPQVGAALEAIARVLHPNAVR